MKKITKILLVVLSVVVVGLVAYIFIFNSSDEQKEPKVIYSSQTVESGLRNISKLSTAEYYYKHMEVMRKEQLEVLGIQLPGTDSAYVYSCRGCITAYLDFSKVIVDELRSTDEMGKESVVQIKITLPEIQLESSLDHKSFEKCYSSEFVFNSFDPEDLNISYEKIENEEMQNAKDNGIIEKAMDNAQMIIENFVKGFSDYENAEIIINF